MDTLRDTAVADPLARAWAVQASAATVGFDWPDISGVIDKVHEEMGEILAARNAGDHAHAKDELGDLLFAVVNLARFLDAAPSQALHRATDRFESRFARVCDLVRAEGKEPQDCTLQRLDEAWNQAKREALAP